MFEPMKKCSVFILLSFLFITGHSQDPDIQIIISPGDSLRHLGNIAGALKLYRQRYLQDPGDPSNTYNYACTFSVNNQPDSAFKYLYLFVQHDSTIIPLTDPDLIHLYDDKRWPAIQNTVTEHFEQKYGKLKKEQEAKVLWAIKAFDQAYLEEITQAEEKAGRGSAVVNALWYLKDLLNKKNLSSLESIVSENNWPKTSDVGVEAAEAAFLVIQHASIVEQKKYLPAIKKLCEENEAGWESYALMYDRIQTGENHKQLYGTQLKWSAEKNSYELFPIEDEKNVDKRRAELGMVPLSQYLVNFGIQYAPK
jgi:hypothetical protein